MTNEELRQRYMGGDASVLADMAAKAPRTMDELLNVSGVGQVKARRYGDAFLAVITGHENSGRAYE